MKALVVDPSRMISSTLVALFARYGIEARAAATGREALAQLEAEPTSLLCFAYELGDMTGFEFLITARARKLHHHEPALLFAATPDKALLDRAMEVGVTQCFSKRHLTQLEQFVERFASQNKRRHEGRVLLVEDSAATAMFYEQVMSRMGLTVDRCTTGEDAIEAFDRTAYDLVVTDYLLAGQETGFAVIRAVRNTPGRKATTPILVVSGFDDMARKVELLRHGANDFIHKPVLAEEMEVRIANLLTVQALMRRLESQHEAMKTMAMHDQLTSLYNRYFLEIKSAGLISEAHAGQTPLSLLVIDVDNFKRINDEHGHKAGDHVLERTASAMQRFASANDIVARVGGEEFVIVMPGVALVQAMDRGEELRDVIEALMPAGIGVTASVGVATLTPGESYDDLFRRADAATYRAKANGRNQVQAAA